MPSMGCARIAWLTGVLVLACATGSSRRATDGDTDRDGVPDDVDLCPLVAEDIDGVDDRDGCPEFPAGYDGNAPPADLAAAERPGSARDTDADGVADAVDACPHEAEDKDGFEDGDGCPDLDNDKDRILDADDKCPNEPETYNARDDDDGCPDRGTVWGRPDLRFVGVTFARNRSVLDGASLALVESVAEAIKSHCFVVEVQGHTSVGERDVVRLGLARAAAARTVLVARGVPARQLTVRSYGSTRPICGEATEACRAHNRRVEFAIDREATPVSCSAPPDRSTP